MHALTAGSRRARPTSLHVFLALVTMVVTLALAIGLAGQPRADRESMADEELRFRREPRRCHEPGRVT